MSERAQDLNILRRQLANWRDPHHNSLQAPRKWRSERSGMDANHLVLIRQLPCCVCPSHRGIEAHHLKSGPARKERGVSLKATDRWALPLCGFLHHNEVEHLGSRQELGWFQSYGIDDPYTLAQALWNATGDIQKMARVLLAHKLAASRELVSRKR